MDRRDFLKTSTLATSLLPGFSHAGNSPSAHKSANIPEVLPEGRLFWLDRTESAYHAGITWGKPWPAGELLKEETLCLLDEQEKSVPLQSWPAAYWPDGSIKWTAHAIPAGQALGSSFEIRKGPTSKPTPTLSVKQNSKFLQVSTGKIECEIPLKGQYIISKMSRRGKLLGQHARMTGLVQDVPEALPGEPFNTEQFASSTDTVSIEQQGPVRTVIKITGKHLRDSGESWLPFTLRLYFYAGAETIKATHTFVFDGDDQKDFIRGLGLRFEVLQRDEVHNRHVRFAGENGGLFAESPRGLTGLRRDPGEAVKAAQIAGKQTPPIETWDPRVTQALNYIPQWNDFSLSQLTANGFQIKKRTKQGHAWIDCDQGKRANGTAWVGGATGGILVGMRDFWQLHPVQMDIRNAAEPVSEVTLWFWSPAAPAMDVRFYHDGMGMDTYEKQLEGLNITYEDYEPGFGSANGVARTTDFTLAVLDSTPSRQKHNEISSIIASPPQVICSPRDYLATGVFGGIWSLPDRSTAAKRTIEDRLALLVKYYSDQVDERHWYGFWNFGDIMHTYDNDRHVWRYDVGGYAWDNSELSPDLWLWYSFLRTADPSTFRLAEQMTRHTRDVDIYHAGPYKGFGSRHNVQHWGCSSKQMRISTAIYRRFHYFLTCDERTGDVLDEVTSADETLAVLSAGRKITDKPLKPGEAGMNGGTDWSAAAANWLTAWERTDEDKYKQYLLNAMKVIGNHPQGFYAGNFKYDIKTKQLSPYPDTGPKFSHLRSVFGLIEINAELNQLLDVPEYKSAWLRYGRIYNAEESIQRSAIGTYKKGNLRVGHSRITANTAFHEKDPVLAKRAWTEFSDRWWIDEDLQLSKVEAPHVLNPVKEAPWVSTNDAAQWALAAIQNLALIGDKLDPE